MAVPSIRSVITPKNFWLWFSGIFLTIGSLFLVVGLSVGVHRYNIEDRLMKEGRTVEGMVLTKKIHTASRKQGKRSSPSYRVTFQFVPTQGASIDGTAEVKMEVWDSLEERGPIQVTYLPDEPEHYRVEGQTSGWVLPMVFAAIGGLLAPVGGFMFFRARGLLQAGKRLQRDGITATATVSDVQVSYLRVNGVNQFAVLYDYQDDRGRSYQGKEYFPPEEAGQWKQGDQVTIRYDRKRPHHSIWIGKQ